MFHSIHSNYNAYARQSTLQISNSKEINSAQNATQSNKATNPANLVLDKSEAVGKVLGYGVDSEGYFTSDFNEAAGLPSDYRIYAKDLENFVNQKLNGSFLGSAFKSIDIAQSLANAYKVFSQLTGEVGQGFSKDDLAAIPQFFQYDSKSLEVTKIYSKDEFIGITYAAPNEAGFYENFYKVDSIAFPNWEKNDFADRAEDIFKGNTFITNANIYKNDDGSISKGGVLVAFFTNAYKNINFIEGETNISGKLAGFDDEFSLEQIRGLNDFLAQNEILFASIDDMLAGMKLKNSDLSVEEFKEKWLELKAENEAKQVELSKQRQNGFAIDTQDDETTEEKKQFKPITGESSRETYKDTNTHNILALAKSQQMADMLAILFNQKSSSSSTFKELQKFIGSKTGIDLDTLSNVNSLREFVASKTKKVDIEA